MYIYFIVSYQLKKKLQYRKWNYIGGPPINGPSQRGTTKAFVLGITSDDLKKKKRAQRRTLKYTTSHTISRELSTQNRLSNLVNEVINLASIFSFIFTRFGMRDLQCACITPR